MSGAWQERTALPHLHILELRTLAPRMDWLAEPIFIVLTSLAARLLLPLLTFGFVRIQPWLDVPQTRFWTRDGRRIVISADAAPLVGFVLLVATGVFVYRAIYGWAYDGL
ncbi:hypothetical protein [Salinarimonas soli]|uniref:Uncharacterized protein n=1 Tax=Salinarimonas soli TaxID=1638099 RepID=A0A5B2V5U8_9HYPH|nr:hypothetical protein [Salinarimonas soli]KAA2234364.1 hypothetical protein F0L46_23925 [Salinarimonas soli]